MIEPKEFKKLLDFVYSAHQEYCTKRDLRQSGRVPVEEMTHETWEEEKAIDEKSPLVQLLKLCDKIASMYDENVRPDPQRRHEWKELAKKLLKNIEPSYKKSRVVSVAKAVLESTDW